MSNGKGSLARNNMSQAFRDGWDRVFLKEKQPHISYKNGFKQSQTTSKPSKPLKTQGKALSGAFGRQVK